MSTMEMIGKMGPGQRREGGTVTGAAAKMVIQTKERMMSPAVRLIIKRSLGWNWNDANSKISSSSNDGRTCSSPL